MNPVARLFGSLANALLDLGLPTIREWLRDRIGPAADVAHVTTDGSLVHLDGVKVPIGPSGLLLLDRATAAITALGRAGLPEVRLHAFSGVLGFGDAAHSFRAEVSFTSSPEPEESAWIAGDLAIANVTWSMREGSPKPKPMGGHARLFVSSSEWRIEGGRLDGEVFRGRFAGSGRFEAADANDVAERDRPLVPRALSTAALALERARVGPFLDAASALAGKGITIPDFVPLDAELDGELSWSASEGGRAELRVAAEAIRATLRGEVGPTGHALAGRIDAHVRPAVLLRGSRVPKAAIPREEDVLALALDIGGELRRPEVKGSVHGSELGFRLGRPRFVPAVVLRDPRCELFVKHERIVVRATALARTSKVILDLDANFRDLFSARGTLRAHAVDAAFLRDVVHTLGVKVAVPDDAAAAVDFMLAPANGAHAPEASEPGRISGALTLTTTSSKIALDLSADGAMRIAGGVAARDVLATGSLTGAVVPVDGDVIVALDVVRGPTGMRLRGTAGAPRLVLEVRGRPDVAPYVLEGVTANVAFDGASLAYDELRFRAHGGRFVARGTIPSVRSPLGVLLDLDLEEGGPELAVALLQLVVTPHAEGTRPWIPIVADDGPRQSEEIAIPRGLVGRGRLRLRGDLSLHADVRLETTSRTSLDLRITLAANDGLDGSTCSGTLSVEDAVVTGMLDRLAVEGWDASQFVEVDVLLRSSPDDGTRALVAFRSERLTVPIPTALLVVSDAVGMLRVDRNGAAWSDVCAQLCGGTITSSGLTGGGELNARVSFSQVAVHDLPAIAGVEPRSYVRGRLSGSVIGRMRDESLHAAGDVVLEEATFPALDLARPALARYGLRPPNEDASAPVTATIVGTDRGIFLRDVQIALRGASLRGELGLSRERMLDGHAEVVLEEGYLRTSKVLTLPRVLTDRLVLPVRIEGPLELPRLHGAIAESLGRFLKDNRVSAFVTSAVEEAQHLLGRHPIPEPEPSDERPPPHEKELDAILRRALGAYAADWEALAQREKDRAARYRIG